MSMNIQQGIFFLLTVFQDLYLKSYKMHFSSLKLQDYQNNNKYTCILPQNSKIIKEGS